MTTQVQFRRGTTSEHAHFVGAQGELTIDTDKNMAVIHDGVTNGGFDVFRARWERINSDTLLGTNLRYLVDTTSNAITLTPLTIIMAWFLNQEMLLSLLILHLRGI